MKNLFKEYRLYIAELLIGLAFDIMPDNTGEKMSLAEYIHDEFGKFKL